MDKKFLFLIGLIPVIAAGHHKPYKPGYGRQCPNGFMRFPGIRSCHYFSTEKITWYEARQQCNRLGGALTIIDNKKESDAITNYLIKNFPPKNQIGDHDYWIALNSILVSGEYKWDPTERIVTTNKTRDLEFENWETDEPNFGGENPDPPAEFHDCVRLNNLDADGNMVDRWRWADFPCDVKFFYICEAIPGREFRCNNSPRTSPRRRG